MKNSPIFLIRGIPGAGKSTFAKRLKAELDKVRYIDGYKLRVRWGTTAIFETDNFFVDAVTGKYRFDHSLLATAHNWNIGEVFKFCRDFPECPCIVANSFTTNEELKPYRVIARENERRYFTISLHTSHPNVHGVPDDVIEKMTNRWEYLTHSWEIYNDGDYEAIINKVIEATKTERGVR